MVSSDDTIMIYDIKFFKESSLLFSVVFEKLVVEVTATPQF